MLKNTKRRHCAVSFFVLIKQELIEKIKIIEIVEVQNAQSSRSQP